MKRTQQPMITTFYPSGPKPRRKPLLRSDERVVLWFVLPTTAIGALLLDQGPRIINYLFGGV